MTNEAVKFSPFFSYCYVTISLLITLNQCATQASKTDLPSTSQTRLKTREGGNISPDDWNYYHQNEWDRVAPDCGPKSKKQSPINVINRWTVYDPYLRLEFFNYDQSVEFVVKNTHHSVMFKPTFTDPPGMLGAPAAVRVIGQENESPIYELVQIHFHWGEKHAPGSEHLLDGKRYAAEMHMVHKRRDKPQNDDGANDLLVIGVMIEEESRENEGFDRVLNGAHQVNATDDEYLAKVHNNWNQIPYDSNLRVGSSGNEDDLLTLLPEDLSSFYTYNGSLTTPPCHEVVTWVLMRQPVLMSYRQFDELNDLYAPNNMKISPNFRTVFSQGQRNVYASFPASVRPSHSSHGLSPPSSSVPHTYRHWHSRWARPWRRRPFSNQTSNRRRSGRMSSLLHSLSRMHIRHRNRKST